MIEIFKEFTFEAAHHLAANVDELHPYAQLHGHSFQVVVFFRGELDQRTGWVADFASLDAAIRPVRNLLDHHYLNDIEGLEQSSAPMSQAGQIVGTHNALSIGRRQPGAGN